MEEFSLAILERLTAKGYRFLLYHNMEHFGLISPIFEEIQTGEGSYVIPIDDQQTFEMAGGVDGFSFYIFEESFSS